ncbi:MAG: IS30 family transposase [Clostridia bacterium]|nr:IS30 family transposase [Clostridia bacterium]NCD03465.1 IS30 family transposase [Clostridia bacterium]
MGKYLTEYQRYQIEMGLRAKMSVSAIASLLGKHRSTIYREIKRGLFVHTDTELREKLVYAADVSYNRYLKVRVHKGVDLKIGNDYRLVEFLENKIVNEHYSPDAALALAKRSLSDFKTMICTSTLYHYIDSGLFLNLTNKHLVFKKIGKKRNYNAVHTVSLDIETKRIEERPESVNNRSEFGHWEIDCVCSKQGVLPALLTLTERKSRFELIFKIPDKSQKSVISVLDKLERSLGCGCFKQTFKTITADNGVEFRDWRSMEKSLFSKVPRTQVYFCHSYSSWERGTNENHNRMIRRFFPKGTDFGTVSRKQLLKVQDWMNNYPRKKLGYLSPAELFSL